MPGMFPCQKKLYFLIFVRALWRWTMLHSFPMGDVECLMPVKSFRVRWLNLCVPGREKSSFELSWMDHIDAPTLSYKQKGRLPLVIHTPLLRDSLFVYFLFNNCISVCSLYKAVGFIMTSSFKTIKYVEFGSSVSAEHTLNCWSISPVQVCNL